jgi:predicted nucleotidyltransferase component of viral defense system
MKRSLSYYQEKVLSVLSGKITDFYLAGGTALSLYYFHHRESFDLDFFTKKFNAIRISNIIKELSLGLKKETELIAEQKSKEKVRIAVYSVQFTKTEALKIDFVEDYANLIKKPRLVNGINVLSLEDIYIRKIFAIAGSLQAEDSIGRRIMRGARQEAKDFYDLFCLSSIFMRLSGFAYKYCTPLVREGLIRWYRTYNRLDMKTGLLELKLKKAIDYREMEQHFKKEIDAILEKEVT